MFFLFPAILASLTTEVKSEVPSELSEKPIYVYYSGLLNAGSFGINVIKMFKRFQTNILDFLLFILNHKYNPLPYLNNAENTIIAPQQEAARHVDFNNNDFSMAPKRKNESQVGSEGQTLEKKQKVIKSVSSLKNTKRLIVVLEHASLETVKVSSCVLNVGSSWHDQWT